MPVSTTGLSGHTSHLSTCWYLGERKKEKERWGWRQEKQNCRRDQLGVDWRVGTEGCVFQGGDFFYAFPDLHDSNKFIHSVEFYLDLVTWPNWVSVIMSRRQATSGTWVKCQYLYPTHTHTITGWMAAELSTPEPLANETLNKLYGRRKQRCNFRVQLIIALELSLATPSNY